MSSVIDMIGAAILFGVLVLAVGRIQGNLNSTLYQNTFNLNTQSQAIQLARQFEYELAKAGYRVTGPKISVADSTKITFVGAMSYGGAVDSISYYRGSADSSTANPDDFRFVRYARSSGTQSQRLVMTYFKLAYFDTTNTLIPTPVSSAKLKDIRAIDIKFRVESAEPVTDATTGLSNYNAVTWEKLIYPRNLGKPY